MEIRHYPRRKPRQQRSLIHRQRFGIVKVAARLLSGRAAGMENSGSVLDWQTRQLQFLERRSWNRGNLPPIPYRLRRRSTRFAKPAIRPIMLELEPEQFERQPIEPRFVLLSFALADANELAQSRGKA